MRVGCVYPWPTCHGASSRRDDNQRSRGPNGGQATLGGRWGNRDGDKEPPPDRGTWSGKTSCVSRRRRDCRAFAYPGGDENVWKRHEYMQRWHHWKWCRCLPHPFLTPSVKRLSKKNIQKSKGIFFSVSQTVSSKSLPQKQWHTKDQNRIWAGSHLFDLNSNWNERNVLWLWIV